MYAAHAFQPYAHTLYKCYAVWVGCAFYVFLCSNCSNSPSWALPCTRGELAGVRGRCQMVPITSYRDLYIRDGGPCHLLHERRVVGPRRV